MKSTGIIRDTFAELPCTATSDSRPRPQNGSRLHVAGLALSLAFALAACGGSVTSEVDSSFISGAGAAASSSGAGATGGTGGSGDVGGTGGEAGTGGTGGSEPGAWTPKSISALALWLDGSREVEMDSGVVTRWIDQSGHQNDAVPPAISGGAPGLVTSAFGGKPALHFNGSSSYLVVADDVSLQFGKGDFVVAVAARHTTLPDAGSGVGFFYAKPAAGAFMSDGPMLYGNTEQHTTEAVAQLGAPGVLVKTAQTGLNGGEPMVLVMRRMALPVGPVATLEIRLNGVSSGNGTGESFLRDVSAIGQHAYLGGSPQAQYLAGDIAEVIVVKGPTTDEDLAAIETYLMTKYGI